MLKNKRPDRKFGGLHFDDPWKEWIGGFKRREEAVRDVTRMSNEVWNYRNDLFPVRSIPVVEHPGYVTHDRNFFRIITRGKKISRDLTQYFTEEHYREGIGYSNAHELGEFFELALHEVLVNGISAYAVEWGDVEISDKKYVLPTSLLGINSATLEFLEGQGKVIARQKFSWLAKCLNTYFEYQNHVFHKDELVIFTHPTFYPLSPVAESLRYLKQLRQWLVFILWQGKANAEPTNRSLKVESARYRLADSYLRKQVLARIKVRRIFNQPIGGYNTSLTTYYELYAYTEYKKHLNLLRRHFVKEFNDQLLAVVQKKNKIKLPLLLEYRGFSSDETIDKALRDFEDRKIDVSGFLDAIKDDYDKELF